MAQYSATNELMKRFPSPIPAMVQDGQELQILYRSVGIVPPYLDGNAMGFEFFKFLRNLAINSPSHASCINSKVDTAFGGVLLEAARGMGFYRKREVLPDGTQGGAVSDSFYEMGITPEVALYISKAVRRCILECGNAYIRVRLSVVGGVTKVTFKMLDYTRVAYMEQLAPDGTPVFCVSPVAFDRLFNSFGDYTPEFIAASTTDNFNWSKTGRGAVETVLHVRETTERSPWYGETPIVAAILYAFSEWQLGDYNNREAANDWISRVLIFFQDEAATEIGARGVKDVKRDFKRLSNEIKETVLKSSQSSSGVAAFMYPNGEEPPTVVTLPPMTNQDYFTQMSALNASFIYAVHNWSKVLTGFEAPAAGIGGNVVLDAFMSKEVSVIKPMQRAASSMWDGILKAIAERGGTDLTQYGLGFVSPFAEMIEQQKQLPTDGITN